MATYTINIDERTAAGKSLLNYLRALGILLEKTRGNEAKGKNATLQAIKDMKGPRLLHIHTTKGKGYEPAEKNPTIKDTEEGRVTKYASFDDFKRAMNEI